MTSDYESVWPMAPIGDLLQRVVRPVSVDPQELYQEIGVRSHCNGVFHKRPVLGSRIGSKRVFWVEPNCLVFNIIFAWEQAVAMTTEAESGMIASHRFPMYCAKNGELLPEYALLFFSSPRGKHLLGLASPGGAGRNKTLGQAMFARMRVPVPPLDHQVEAVRVAKEWTRANNALESALARKLTFAQGLRTALATGQLRFPEFGGSTCDEGTPPTDWTVARLGDVTTIRYSNVDKKTHPDEVPVRLCNYNDVWKNEYVHNAMPFMEASASDGEVVRFRLQPEDVLLTKDSETRDEIASAATVIDAADDLVLGYHLALVRPKPEYAVGRFIAAQLSVPKFRKHFIRAACGATRYGLGMSWMKRAEVWLPPLAEQTKIADTLMAAHREITALRALAEQLRLEKWGLIQRMLSGEIERSTTEVSA